MSSKIRVTVWNEFRHEKLDEKVRQVYPDGIHAAIASHIQSQPDLEVRTATLDEAEHGLTEEVVQSTDVLLWWGHMAHGEVQDAIVERVVARVQEGMGLIVLHSGHHSKVFKRLMGTTCNLHWREAGEKERLWVVEPSHPIAEGLGEYFELPHTEMYGERFDIPTPEHLIFVSWFQGGEVFRSGCTWQRGHGRIFYFRPGHETFPIYYDPNVLRVIVNGIHWAAPRLFGAHLCPNSPPLEPRAG
ncbi:MAG: ThuA domain-containing protein, partial [Candidatus Omnitrophica bacterium]|nr:ThuA domain-containing protein [Candidatus Omnitrophota bacterium]